MPLWGRAVWFRCPARGCGRRVAILYGGESSPVATAIGLPILPARVSRRPREFARMEDQGTVRRVGSLLDPLFRRKGMHRQTFRRLEQVYEQACSASDFALLVQMGMSIDEVLRLAE